MPLRNMAQLEARVRGLVSLVQELKTRNAQLEADLRTAKDRLSHQTALGRRWEEERTDIRLRIEKVLGEMELFECLDEATISKEVALD
jgi:hypothetical protein